MPFPLPLLLFGGAALLLGGTKKRRRSATNGSKEDEIIGEGTGTPWFLTAYYDRKGDAEWRARRCSNEDAFLKAALPALKERLDQFRHEAAAANFVGFNEGDPAGIAYRADLQATVENLLTVHCE